MAVRIRITQRKFWPVWAVTNDADLEFDGFSRVVGFGGASEVATSYAFAHLECCDGT